jgi:hypothetical protein
MKRFAGIDWATQPKKRAVVVLQQATPGGLVVHQVRSSVTDQEALELYILDAAQTGSRPACTLAEGEMPALSTAQNRCPK